MAKFASNPKNKELVTLIGKLHLFILFTQTTLLPGKQKICMRARARKTSSFSRRRRLHKPAVGTDFSVCKKKRAGLEKKEKIITTPVLQRPRGDHFAFSRAKSACSRFCMRELIFLHIFRITSQVLPRIYLLCPEKIKLAYSVQKKSYTKPKLIHFFTKARRCEFSWTLESKKIACRDTPRHYVQEMNSDSTENENSWILFLTSTPIPVSTRVLEFSISSILSGCPHFSTPSELPHIAAHKKRKKTN